MKARRTLSRALVVLTSLLLFATAICWYAREAVLDSGGFADRAAESVQDADVRDLIAQRVTDGLILRHQADLTAARPLIFSAVSRIVGGDAFGSLLRRAVLDLHETVLGRRSSTATLTIADAGTVAATALQKLNPEVAARIDEPARISLVKQRIVGSTGDIARDADRLDSLAWVLAVLAVVIPIAALAVSPDRRRTAAGLGVAAIVAGAGIVIALALARAVVLARVDGVEERAAAGAIWDAYLGDLRTWGWLLAGTGAVVAAAASSLLRPVGIESPLAAAGRLVAREPDRPLWRLLRALALMALGLLLVLQASVALQVAVTLAGAYLLYAGVAALLRLIAQPAAPAGARGRRWLAVPVVAVLLVLVADTVFLAGGGGGPEPVTVAACNGAAALCDRPLDAVALAATHNSMSAPLKGWFASQQDRGIDDQLRDGVRGLLIDTYYGEKLANGRVRTSFASPADLGRAIKQDGVSRQAYEAALRLRERVGFHGSGKRGIYMCHTFCELGATPLAAGLKTIHDFLVTHPEQVLVVLNQDEVTPADFVNAVADAGLTRYAFTPPPSGARWPTLRKMVEADHRLVVLAENEAGDAPWYQLAYRRLLQESPFAFRRPAQLADTPASCADNRGPANAPLFLLNNWVTTDPVPRPSNAAEVNAYPTLFARARACERDRRHVINLIAVDFYRRGDVFRVVDALNGVGPDP